MLQGHGVLWTTTATLLQRLLAANRDMRLPHQLNQLDHCAWLILDDIGYVHHDRDQMKVLFTLLAERYEGKRVIITRITSPVIGSPAVLMSAPRVRL